ncbi:MAG: hypothetical protein N2381_04035 [Armatimonadetes bacterium]|nr:hypothetical protein [Armatimonadota bacterium]
MASQIVPCLFSLVSFLTAFRFVLYYEQTEANAEPKSFDFERISRRLKTVLKNPSANMG